MTRDLAVPVLLGLLALAALPSTGLVFADGPFPATPGAYLTFALLLTAAFAFLVVPWLSHRGGGGVLRIAVLALAALPFLVYGLTETPAPPDALLLPGWAFLLALAISAVLAAMPRRIAAGLGATVLVFLGADALLGSAGLPLLPGHWVGGAGPVLVVGGETGRSADLERPPRPGLRVGAPVVVPETPFGRGPGPWLEPADRGTVPGPGEGPWVLLLDGRHDGEVRREGAAGTFHPLRGVALEPALALDAFDAVLVLPGAWSAEDPQGRFLSASVAQRTGRGGLLVGPAPGRTWPMPLGRLLGAAGRSEDSGAAGVRAFGLGRVVRAASEAQARDVLAAGLWRPTVRTVFDDALRGRGGRAPPVPEPFAEAVASRDAERGPQGALLLVYALVAGVMDRVLRGAGPRFLGVLGPALAVTAGLLWTSPAEPSVRAVGLRLGLGGGDGRRVEAVLLQAGPGGWAGHVTFEGGGLVQSIGASAGALGRVRLAPGRRAWILREALAGADTSGRGRPVDAPFLRAFVRGLPERGVSTRRIDGLSVRVEGAPPFGAWTLESR